MFVSHMHLKPYSNEGEDLSHTWGYNGELSITSAWFPIQIATEKFSVPMQIGVYPSFTPQDSSRSGNILLISEKQWSTPYIPKGFNQLDHQEPVYTVRSLWVIPLHESEHICSLWIFSYNLQTYIIVQIVQDSQRA